MAVSFLARVVAAMERIAPLQYAEVSWDNVGTLVEHPEPRDTKVVMLTIDLTSASLKEAVDNKASVIVAYHPPIFRAFKSLKLHDEKQAIILRAIASGLSIYSPHTALDACDGGINDWLIDGLTQGIDGKKTPIKPATADTTGKVGAGRIFHFNENAPLLTPEQLIARVKSHLGLPHVRLAVGANTTGIRSIAVCAGSGASLLHGLAVDAFVTGELGHHETLAANAAGTTVVLAEHSNTERGYLPTLKTKLHDALSADVPEVAILVAKSDRDPLIIV